VVELDDIRFVVDENTLALGKAVASLRSDTAIIGRAPVNHILKLGMPDVEWIPLVAARGWVVSTIDHHLRTRPHEARIALQHGLKCINLRSAGNLSRWMQLVRLTTSWDVVEDYATNRKDGPWWLSLTKHGHRELSYVTV
jgi:PIN like domain